MPHVPRFERAPDHVWVMDFVFDTCANGRALKCLPVLDEWTKEGLAIDVRSGIRGARVVEVLSRLVSDRGTPRFIRTDNGPSSPRRRYSRG